MSFQAMNWSQKVAVTGHLKTGEILVLMLLADYADEAWSCFPGIPELVSRSQQSDKTVRRQIKRMTQLGLITTDSNTRAGRGRTGLRFFLHEDSLEELKNTVVEVSETPRTRRPVTGTERDKHGEVGRPVTGTERDDAAVRSSGPSGHSRQGRPVIDGIVGVGALTGNARGFNHQSDPSSSARPVTAGPVEHPGADDEDEDDHRPVMHRGVDLGLLGEQLPFAAGGDVQLVRSVVDVVLDRATARVNQPDRYVLRAAAADPSGVLDEALRRAPALKRGDPGRDGADAVPGQQDRSGVASGTPCTNPDHWQGDVNLNNCGACRMEARAEAPVPHFDQLSDEDVARWPREVRDHVERLRAVQAVSA